MKKYILFIMGLIATTNIFSQVQHLTEITLTVEYTTEDGKDETIDLASGVLNNNYISFIGGKGEVVNPGTYTKQTEENKDLFVWIDGVDTYSASVMPEMSSAYFGELGFCISKTPNVEISDNIIGKPMTGGMTLPQYQMLNSQNIAEGKYFDLYNCWKEDDNTNYVLKNYDGGLLFYASLRGLEYMTTYYVRPYVKFYNGYIMYGGEKSFTTPQTIAGAMQNAEDITEWRYSDASGVTLVKDALLAIAGYTEEPEQNVKDGIAQDLATFLVSDIIPYPAYPTVEPMPECPPVVNDPGELLEYEAWCEREWRDPDLDRSVLYYERYLAQYEEDKQAFAEYPEVYAAYQKDSTEYADVIYPAYLQKLSEYEETCKNIDATNRDNFSNGTSILGKLKSAAYRNIECTDGTLYIVKDIPADIAKAFQEYFYGGISFSPWGNVNMDYTGIAIEIDNVVCDESWGVPNNEFVRFSAYTASSRIGINCPKYLHPVTYTISITIVNPIAEGDSRGNRFQTYIYEKNDQNKYDSSVRLTPPNYEENGYYYITDETKKVETITLGEYTFNGNPNSMIILDPSVTNSMAQLYSRDFRIAEISLTPVKDK